MGVWTRSALVMALLVITALAVPRVAAGQFGDFTYTLDPVVGNPGDIETSVLRLENTTTPLLAGSTGVCHSTPDATVVSAVAGSALTNADFVDLGIVAGGVSLGFVIDLIGVGTLPPGLHDLITIDYQLIGSLGSTTLLTACDTIGVPTTSTVVIVPPGTSLSADTVPTTISIVPVGPPASDPDLDMGETTFVSPVAASSPTDGSTVEVTNVSSGPDQSVMVSESTGSTQPSAGGFAVFGRKLEVMTSMADGTFFMRVTVPFDSLDLAGVDPLLVDLTTYDEVSDTYQLAARLNTVASPGHTGPLGDRTAEMGTTPSALSTDLGDYGVFWNPTDDLGFVWANVDHTTEYAAGIARQMQRGDCNVDGGVDIGDAIALLSYLFPTGAAAPLGCEKGCDGNDDGLLDIGDAVRVLSSLFGMPTDPLPAPGSNCGVDPVHDTLECLTSACP